MRGKGIGLALFLTAVQVFAAEPPLPADHERYIVVLRGESGEIVSEVKTLGGRLEADLGDRLIITAPPSAIENLSRHARVRYVQHAVVGTLPERTEPRPMSVAGRPVETHTGMTWTSGDYTYDGAGNIATIGTSGSPGTQGYRTYGYDAVSRLKKAEIKGVSPQATHEYQYDVYANRTGAAVNGQWVNVPVDSSTNKLTPTEATYDTAGNQLRRGATEATYDGFGMMTSYRFDAANLEAFVYTASDERIGVLRGTDWTWSLRAPNGKVLRQYRSSLTTPSAAWLWVEDFVYRDGLLLGSERVPEEGGRRHYHLDHLGSARLVTGANGSLISEHDFLPFGEERTTIQQHVAKGFDREEPLRFTSHERDFDVAQPNDSSAYIDYMHARYYRAEAGRFLSVDPVIDMKKALRSPQMWNRYSYVMNNPILYNDPTGKLAATTAGVERDLKERKLTNERDALAKYAQKLSADVKAGKLDSKKAVDMYFNKAKELTKGTNDNMSNALLVATGAAIAIRGSVGNNITRPSMGQDTLQHYFMSAYNTYDGVPVWAQSFGSNILGPSIVSRKFKMEDDPLDFDANNFGAVFGDVLQSQPNAMPSLIMP